VEDVSSPAALAEKISDDSEPVEKFRADAMHATVKHLLDFYGEEFPGLEGCYSPFFPDMPSVRLIGHIFVDWHRQWLAAGSPLPAQKGASVGGNRDVATDLWNLQIPIRSPMTVQASV
jgi:hypothetical protein